MVLVLAVTLSACHSRPPLHEVSPSIEQLIAGKPFPKVESAIWSDVRAFYTQRENAPAWIDVRRPTEHGVKAIALLNTARQHGFVAT